MGKVLHAHCNHCGRPLRVRTVWESLAVWLCVGCEDDKGSVEHEEEKV